MRRIARLAVTALALAFVGTRPALADFSACESALITDDPHQQVTLYTTCITKGGLAIRQRMGAFNNRGIAYRRLGEDDKALQDFTWAIESDPDWATSYINRGQMYEARGDLAKALADFDKAIEVGPSNVSYSAYNAEAWLYATNRDPAVRNGAKAVRLAQKAVSLVSSPATRDTLAAAYAEAGQFDDAVQEEIKAIALAQSKHPKVNTDGFQSRLELYRQGKPFRS
jgi:tetratricopeptide (TPR) repeat protein